MELGSIRCARHGLLLASLFAAHAGPAMPRQDVAVQKMCVTNFVGRQLLQERYSIQHILAKNRDGDDDDDDEEEEEDDEDEDDTNIINIQ